MLPLPVPGLPPANAVAPCGQAGVLGVLPGVIGSLQATEAIKYLLGIGELLTDSLLTYNALTMDFRKVPARRRGACPLCGPNATITTLIDEGKVTCNRKGCKC